MKILVTGGAGFIGSHIVDAYIRMGHQVYIIDSLVTGKRENINQSGKFYEFDIRQKLASELIMDEKFDVINHHAAQMDVRKSVENPGYDADVNILGLINLMQSAVKAKTRKVIFSSSGGTIYGECGDKAPDEKSPASPVSPYGISKLSSELYLKFYAGTYNVKYTILRYGNVYGPRQDPYGEAGVVAIFFNRLLNGENVAIYGDGTQMRDYVYVEDVVEVNKTALNTGDNEIINIGNSAAVSVNELFAAMKKAGSFAAACEYKSARTGELYRNYLNIEKASRILGWKPSYDLQKGLTKTLDYFKAKAAK